MKSFGVRSGLVAVLGGVVVFGTGCRPSFDVPVTSESTIQGSPLAGILPGVNFADFASMNLADTQEFKNQGVSKDQIESVKLKSAVLDVTEPANGNLDFLNSLKFEVAKSDNDAKVAIAGASSIARSTGHLVLKVEDVELAPYVTASSMKVTTNADGTVPSSDRKIKASLVFEVVPKIF